jgi:transposase
MRKEPAVSIKKSASGDLTLVGLDVHKDSITAAVLEPTGYELARLLHYLGVACEVIAPSLIPVAPGAKVKTDSRDARRLVHLYRAASSS